MIELQAAMLCDAASIREGLLHVLGAGITFVIRPNYPAPLNASIGLLFGARDLPEAGEDHAFSVTLRREDGEAEPGEIKANVKFQRPPDGSRLQSLPVALDLHGTGLSAPGAYEILVSVDGHDRLMIPFEAKVGGEEPTAPFE